MILHITKDVGSRSLFPTCPPKSTHYNTISSLYVNIFKSTYFFLTMMHFPWGDWASSDFSETVVADGDGGKVYKLAFILIGRSSQNYF
jgi:hypothetical protein